MQYGLSLMIGAVDMQQKRLSLTIGGSTDTHVSTTNSPRLCCPVSFKTLVGSGLLMNVAFMPLKSVLRFMSLSGT